MTISSKLFYKNIYENRLSPILKWAGGKEQELKHIHPALPESFDNYYEPFIGGGAVYFSVIANNFFINDKSHELINLYQAIKESDRIFLSHIDKITQNWISLENIIDKNSTEIIEIYKDFSQDNLNEKEVETLIVDFISKNELFFTEMIKNSFDIEVNKFLHEIKKNMFSKIKRMKKIEVQKGKLPQKDILDNFESALKSAYYMYCRYLYNNIQKLNISKSIEVSIFFFVRNFAYSGMFRYNKNGDFNVPYGGIGYNKKYLSKKTKYFKSQELLKHLKQTTICNYDFKDFFEIHVPTSNDFIFLDPPYDSEFSTYAKNEFTREDQKRLADYLINNCQAKWMLIIKNTSFIFDLYDKKGIYIKTFDKKYMVSFQNRNDKNAKHLLIQNYE